MPLEGLGVGGGSCAECARGSRGGAGVGRERGFVLSTGTNAGMSFQLGFAFKLLMPWEAESDSPNVPAFLHKRGERKGKSHQRLKVEGAGEPVLTARLRAGVTCKERSSWTGDAVW